MSGRFAMAVHALTLLAQSDEGYSSAFVAGSVNTNAVFLRRVLRDLVEAGLVDAAPGRGGGYRLSRPAQRITLAQVYAAMEPQGPLSPSPAEPSPRCPVGACMRGVFAEVMDEARAAVTAGLAKRTVADLAREVRAMHPKDPQHPRDPQHHKA